MKNSHKAVTISQETIERGLAAIDIKNKQKKHGVNEKKSNNFVVTLHSVLLCYMIKMKLKRMKENLSLYKPSIISTMI
ncbi:hypothetical protein CHISP_3124 [Chitinispirillum alkaliphilum]|nr:hypothetical protein CHISP_3124 [Chitinispirillum alkaliphilum]